MTLAPAPTPVPGAASVCSAFTQNADSYYLLIAIALRASQAILVIYGHDDYGVEMKADSSPLTDADKAAHDVITAALKKSWPSIPVVSEEDQDRSAYESVRRGECHWLVDPLDGTKEFIARNGQFTVNIGLCKNGQPIAGVVMVPVTGECYFGGAAYGAYRVNLKEALTKLSILDARELSEYIAWRVERIHVASADWSDPGLTVMASRSHGNDLTNAVLDTFNNPILIKAGSSLKILKIADGQAHVYPRLVPCCEWDTCAAHAVLFAAGGHMYQINERKKIMRNELEYGKPDILNPFFICTGNIANLPHHLVED